MLGIRQHATHLRWVGSLNQKHAARRCCWNATPGYYSPQLLPCEVVYDSQWKCDNAIYDHCPCLNPHDFDIASRRITCSAGDDTQHPPGWSVKPDCKTIHKDDSHICRSCGIVHYHRYFDGGKPLRFGKHSPAVSEGVVLRKVNGYASKLLHLRAFCKSTLMSFLLCTRANILSTLSQRAGYLPTCWPNGLVKNIMMILRLALDKLNRQTERQWCELGR